MRKLTDVEFDIAKGKKLVRRNEIESFEFKEKANYINKKMNDIYKDEFTLNLIEDKLINRSGIF
jgi:hypothetical protein